MKKKSVDHNNYSTYEIRLGAIYAITELGRSVEEVAKLLGVSKVTVYLWITRYEEYGVKGLHRKPGSGRPRILLNLKPEKLKEIILSPSTEFGFSSPIWTSRELHQIISKKFRTRITYQTFLRSFHQLGLMYKSSKHSDSTLVDPEVNDWINTMVPKVKLIMEEQGAKVYFLGEMKISLSSILGKRTEYPSLVNKTVSETEDSLFFLSAFASNSDLFLQFFDSQINSNDIIAFLKELANVLHDEKSILLIPQTNAFSAKSTKQFLEHENTSPFFYLPKKYPLWRPTKKIWR